MSQFSPIDSNILVQLQAVQPIRRWIVGFSGGIDSTVLLHSVLTANRQLESPRPIVALHINHQLSPNADQWQQHCQHVAQSLHVEYSSHMVEVLKQGNGLEAAARDARYQVFNEFVEEGDCLLLGQHQDDQAETVLLRLLRGAGVKGLAAMPQTRQLTPLSSETCTLLRPLLTISRESIEAYAKQHQLQWVDDESNEHDHYDRNYLRHTVLPTLTQRWPATTTQLAKTAQRMRESEQLLDMLAEKDINDVDLQTERLGTSISLQRLMSLAQEQANATQARVNNLLRYWCARMEYPTPDSDQLSQIDAQFFSATERSSSACVSWGKVELRQFAGRLYLMPALPAFGGLEAASLQSKALPWDARGSLSLGVFGQLRVTDVNINRLNTPKGIVIPRQQYQIRWRQGGERCTPRDRQHSQTVKKLLQEYGLETWLRDRVPLLYSGEDVVAVGDLWINKVEAEPQYINADDTCYVHLQWIL